LQAQQAQALARNQRAVGILEAAPSGEYYMGGDIARVGVYSLTGRQIDLRQAIVAAGMWEKKDAPHYVTVTRREADGNESYPLKDEPVDYGLQSQKLRLVLKPNDVVMISSSGEQEKLAAQKAALEV